VVTEKEVYKNLKQHNTHRIQPGTLHKLKS